MTSLVLATGLIAAMFSSMGLHVHNFNSLIELKRLAGMARDAGSRQYLTTGEWPMAMIAYVMEYVDDEPSLAGSIAVYRDFSSCCGLEARSACLEKVRQFVIHSQGKGWRGLLLTALADEDSVMRRNAAFLTGTLSPGTRQSPFTGFNALLEALCSPPMIGQQDNAPVLEALLSASDLRLLDPAKQAIPRLDAPSWEALLQEARPIANALSCEWLLSLLEFYPALSGCIAGVLADMPGDTEEIVDLILPVPTWAFRNAAVQPLHGWSMPEYYDRMSSRLQRSLDGEQLERVRTAWSR